MGKPIDLACAVQSDIILNDNAVLILDILKTADNFFRTACLICSGQIRDGISLISGLESRDDTFHIVALPNIFGRVNNKRVVSFRPDSVSILAILKIIVLITEVSDKSRSLVFNIE